MDIFKEASKLGLRFTTSRGVLSTEQLWSLSQKDLTVCIKAQKAKVAKTTDDELSFLDESAPTVDKVEQLRFDILKDIYLTNQDVLTKAKAAKDKKDHNTKIAKLIADKKEESLSKLSIEELEKLVIE